MRVALAVTLGDFPVDPEVEANTRTFADALRAAGAIVDEVTVPLSRDEVTRAALVHYGSIMGPSMLEFSEPDDPRFMPYTQHFLEALQQGVRLGRVLRGPDDRGEGAPGPVDGVRRPRRADLPDARDHRASSRATTTPSTASPSPASYVDLYIFAALTPVFNIASRHPVLNVPSGRASNGVPTGVQVVARPYDDVTAFHVGAAAERELGLWADPTWRPAL